MYHVSAQGIEEQMINVHYYCYYLASLAAPFWLHAHYCYYYLASLAALFWLLYPICSEHH